ncbi:MAG TPA: hypothetical protein VLI21_13835 [Casimicrobiaceae bacterium]|nr:hypothetical protein [Casimicrobiaceae bacterium]
MLQLAAYVVDVFRQGPAIAQQIDGHPFHLKLLLFRLASNMNLDEQCDLATVRECVVLETDNAAMGCEARLQLAFDLFVFESRIVCDHRGKHHDFVPVLSHALPVTDRTRASSGK